MATQSPLLPPGQWVQYNVTVQDPRAPKPTSDEQGIGQIRQSFTKSDGPYYQVVWNPGSKNPKSALYHGDQLCALTQQQAQQVSNDMAQGSYTGPDLSQLGIDFQQPNVPSSAAPPSEQQPGMETL